MTSQPENMTAPAGKCIKSECNLMEAITKKPITKECIADVMDKMRVKGAPASDRIKKDYCSRLGGLLKRGILQVLDQPDLFEEKWKAQGWTACNSLAYLKTLSQWVETLHWAGRWSEFYTGELGNSSFTVRDMTRKLNTENNLQLAARRPVTEQ
jgi:hypothetical protein